MDDESAFWITIVLIVVLFSMFFAGLYEGRQQVLTYHSGFTAGARLE